MIITRVNKNSYSLKLQTFIEAFSTSLWEDTTKRMDASTTLCALDAKLDPSEPKAQWNLWLTLEYQSDTVFYVYQPKLFKDLHSLFFP